MNVLDVKHDIMNKSVKPFYVFAGEEVEVMKAYIHKIAETIESEIYPIDNISDVFAGLSTNSLFAIRKCYLVWDDKEFLSSENWENVMNREDENVIILVLSDLDKRGKFYKAHKDDITLFEHLTQELLAIYIERKIDLSSEATRALCEVCENDYGRILLEIDKVQLYSQVTGMTPTKALETLLNDGTIHVPDKDVIFDFADAVCRRKRELAFDLLYEDYRAGENPLTLLSVLYNNFKQMLQVQSCQGKDIAGITGLSIPQVKAVQRKIGAYSIGELLNAINLIADTVYNIKVGSIPAEIATDFVLVNIL